MTADFPKRPEAHVSEEQSIRIFQECLPRNWIFRDQATRSDYGIDAEVELVTADGELRGDLVKVQLKGQARVDFNENGVAGISGIKQSTLRYWLGLSRYCNVVACITDNSAREVYFTPVFWEATFRLDGTDETRTIHFTNQWRLTDEDGPWLFRFSTVRRPLETVRAHEILLRALPRILHDFLWVCQADPWTLHGSDDVVRDWLKNGYSILELVEEQDRTLFDWNYWRQESNRQWGDSPMRGAIRDAYLKTFPLVFEEARRISKRVQMGRYYWSREFPEYLELVDSTSLPNRTDYLSIYTFLQTEEIRASRV
jgi:hypothetical protein